MILDGGTIQSTPESGPGAGYDGYKRRRGPEVHTAVDTLGHLLAPHVTPADEQERAQVATLADQVHRVTGGSVGLAYVDQGYTGEQAFDEAAGRGIILEVVTLPEAKRGIVLLPRRWVAERSFGWGRDSEGWGGTTSGSPTRSRGCTTSPSACSCSARPPSSSPGVHNTRGSCRIPGWWAVASGGTDILPPQDPADMAKDSRHGQTSGDPLMVNIGDLIDDAKCFETVRSMRWPEGVACPHCSATAVI